MAWMRSVSCWPTLALWLWVGCESDPLILGTDAAMDAEPADARADSIPTVVTATVFDLDHAVVPNVRVLFQAADSSVVADLLTDAQGQAAATLATGGFVTVALDVPHRDDPSVYTFANVVSGDELFFEAPPQLHLARFQVQAPQAPSAFELFSTACSGGGAGASDGATIELCSGTADLLAVTQSSSAFIPSISVATDVPLILAGPFLQFDTKIDVAFSDLPPEQEPVLVTLDLATPRGVLAYLSVANLIPPASKFVTPMNGTVTSRVEGPGVPGGSAIIDADFNQTGNVQRRLLAWMPTSTATLSLSMPSTFLHPFTTLPTYQDAKVTWAQDVATGVDPNLVYADLDASSYRWRVISRASGTSLGLPHLPGALDQTATLHSLVTANSSYDLMPHFFAADFDDRYVDGPQGRVVFQLYFP